MQALPPISWNGRSNKRRFEPEEIAAKLKQASELRAAGMAMHEVACRLGVSDTTLYNWQKRQRGGAADDSGEQIAQLRREIAALKMRLEHAGIPAVENGEKALP